MPVEHPSCNRVASDLRLTLQPPLHARPARLTRFLGLLNKGYSLFKHGSYANRLPSAVDRPLSLSIMFGINDKHRIYLAYYPHSPQGDELIHFELAILVAPRTPWLHRLRAAPLERATLYRIAKTTSGIWHYETERIRPYRYNCAGLVLLGHLPSHFTDADLYYYMAEVPIVQDDPDWGNMNWTLHAIQVFPPSPSPMALTPVITSNDSTPFLSKVSCPQDCP
jgi:hypothetical protein